MLLGNPGTTDDPAPTESGTWPASSQYDISRYTVQAWSGSSWQTVASTSGNTKHIVRLAFAPVTTDRIRVIPVDDASNGQTANDNLVSLTEIEVRSPAGAGEIRTQRFDAWGTLEQAAGSVPTYGYTGREPDATGLIHYRARYYHPELGRFVSRDPLGLSAGINPYAYADGNPVLFNDPDGLLAKLAWNTSSDYLSRNATRILDGTQTVLDVVGLVPGVGEVADGANALIYLGRGDNTNAALSGAAMIPFVGWGATTAKVAGKVDNAVDGANAVKEPLRITVYPMRRSVDELSQAAAAADRGGLTAAGRALQKHGGREGSAFPAVKGNPLSVNQQGQHAVDDILTSPGSTTVTRNHPRFGQVTEVRAPDGRGVRYGADGKFIGFLEPNK